MHIFELATYGKVEQAFLMNLCLLKKVYRVEAPLIVDYDDVLAGEPLSDLIHSVTSLSLAHFESYSDILGSIRIIVAPDDIIRIILQTFELFLPGVNLSC